MDNPFSAFIHELSSKSPVPGGGGASALIGAVGVALCSMVANLTTGKKAYAQHQQDIDRILSTAAESSAKLLALIDRDAEVFEPLSKAYGIPKDNPDRDRILEAALVEACSVPMDILKEVSGIIGIIEALAVKGSRLALSDVGVAAAACRAAMEGAAMNIFINTKLMKNRRYAAQINAETDAVLTNGVDRCNAVYHQIAEKLRSL